MDRIVRLANDRFKQSLPFIVQGLEAALSLPSTQEGNDVAKLIKKGD